MPSSSGLDRKSEPVDETTDWLKCFSATHKCDYWFRSTDGTTSWEDPFLRTTERKRKSVDNIPQSDVSKANAEELSSIKVARRENHTSSEEKSSSSALKIRPEVAIIVPYRDLHKEQCRKQQLDRFVPFISKFMELHKTASSYRIYIIEQSNDNRKFNRGKLLNIGFQLACADGCKALIFHDVDLLPSPDLNEFYYKIPDDKPIHIARVWDRYSANEGYFGGITSFSESQFRRINGFPNNFWGWGGEDDELYKRTRKVGITSTYPTIGKITDMENMNLKSKLQFLRDNKVWKCMNKTEVLEEHASSWDKNGLSSLKFRELSRVEMSPSAVMITVDVCLNSHWTDLVCGVSDTQLFETADALRTRFHTECKSTSHASSTTERSSMEKRKS